jgi:hypothetical protein
MTQTAGRRWDSKYQKYSESSFSWLEYLEWLAMPHTLAHVKGSMADQTTVSNMSYSAPSSRDRHGWPNPAILRFIGSNQKPHGLWPNAHPLNHVGDVFSSEMCVYIPQNVPKPQRNRNLKNQNFDPARIRTLVSGVIDSDAWRLNR